MHVSSVPQLLVSESELLFSLTVSGRVIDGGAATVHFKTHDWNILPLYSLIFNCILIGGWMCNVNECDGSIWSNLTEVMHHQLYIQ